MVVRTPPSRVQAGTMSTAQTSVWSTTAGQCLLRQAIWGVGGGHVVPTQTLSLEVICEIHKVQKL